jgi:hypothetical protein
MTTSKQLGIWMDHASAHFWESGAGTGNPTTIESPFTHEEKEESLQKGEHLMHNKEQGEQGAYYRKIGEVILNYQEVVLFGPTNAKTELFNILKEDHHFDEIKITVQESDKLTEPQQQAFVKKYFE